MTPRRSIFHNVFFFSIGQFVALFLGVITHSILARAVGPEQYGILGFALTIVSYFGLVASLGTDTWGARGISRNVSDVTDITGKVVSLRLALSIAAFAALWLMFVFWRPAAPVTAVILIQFAGVFIAAFTLDFAFQGAEQMREMGKRLIITAVLALAGMAIFMQISKDVITAAIVFQSAAAIGAIVMVIDFVRRFGGFRFNVDIGAWKKILRQSAPIAITGLVAAIYLSIDIVMLGIFRPQAEVGLYVAAGKILTIGMIATTIFRTAFFPVLSRLLDQPETRREASTHHAEAIVFFGGLISVGGFLLAPEIIYILFGATFAGAELALRILMINLLFAYFVSIYQLQLLSWDLQKQQMNIVILGAALNVVLNLIFIPRFGMAAAAVTTLVSTFTVMLLSIWILLRHKFEIHGSLVAKVTIVSAVIAAGGFLLLPQFSILSDNMIFRFVGGGLLIVFTYMVVALALRLFHPKSIFQYMTDGSRSE